MFKILGIKILEGCYESVHKVLKVGETYLLFDYYQEDNGNENTLKCAKTERGVENGLYNVTCDNGRETAVTVTGVVGQNGDGKSTFVEMALRLLNNFAYAFGFLTDQESLHYNIGVAGILYYEVEGHIYAIRCEGGEKAFDTNGNPNMSCYKDGEKIEDIDLREDDITKKQRLKELHLEELFYTMVINYSLYAYNSLTMMNETKDGGSWIDELFHKNDSYQTPVVLNPMRTKGNIDVNNEEHLSYQRLLSLYTISGDNEEERKIKEHETAIGFAFYQEKESKFVKKTIEAFFSEHYRDDYSWQSVDIFFVPVTGAKDEYQEQKEALSNHFMDFWREFDGLYKRNKKLMTLVGDALAKDWMNRSSETDFNKYATKLTDHQLYYKLSDLKPYQAGIDKFLKSEPFKTMNYAEFYRMVRVMKLWDMLQEKCVEIDCDLNEAIENRKQPLYAAKLYVLYKVMEIMNTYTPYRDHSYIEDRTFEMLVNPISKNIGFNRMKGDLQEILEKDDYTTLKLRQALNYIRNYQEANKYYQASPAKESIPKYEVKAENTYYVTFKDLKKLLTGYKGYDGVSKIMSLLPPPIFIGDIIIRYQDEKEEKYHDMASMSSGERQRLNSVGSFIYHLRNLDAEQTDDSKIQYKNLFVVFEEVELYFHPEYQKGYINSLLKQIRQSNLKNVKSISLLFVTHSPFILSDVIKSNILYLKDGKDARAIMKVQTFASNINELLAESFFLKGGFAGEFASEVINDLVQYLLGNSSKRQWNMKLTDQLIELVGDDVVKMQLRKLYAQKYGRESQGYKAWLKKEYERLGLDKEN